jgi:hypothetical protein
MFIFLCGLVGGFILGVVYRQSQEIDAFGGHAQMMEKLRLLKLMQDDPVIVERVDALVAEHQVDLR